MALRSRLEEEYSAPLDVVLERDPPPGIGDDHVCAVNLTRPITSGSARAQALAFARCQAAEEGVGLGLGLGLGLGVRGRG